MPPQSQETSGPRRIAKYGILGAFLGVGVLEAISFLFLACPCAPLIVQPHYQNQLAPMTTEEIPAPPKFGTPVTP